MRLELLTPAHVRRALEVYLAEAWPERCGVSPTAQARAALSDLEKTGDSSNGRRLGEQKQGYGDGAEREPSPKGFWHRHLNSFS